jgi:hypothetical protein
MFMWNRKIRVIAALFAIGAAVLLGGCVLQQEKEKVQDLEFTVMNTQELPEALQDQLEAKKEEEFTLTYSDNEYLYIARGYGMQETGGYSIVVQECYLTDNTICVGTVLSGPAVGETVEKSPSYPFIVLKVELREEDVVFL